MFASSAVTVKYTVRVRSAVAENSVLVAGLEDSKKVGYGIHYAFELEDGNYTVEVTFFDEWSHPARILALKVGGEKVAEGCFGLLRPETLQAQTTVGGGQLTVDIVGGTGNHDDAMVAAIVIRKAV